MKTSLTRPVPIPRARGDIADTRVVGWLLKINNLPDSCFLTIRLTRTKSRIETRIELRIPTVRNGLLVCVVCRWRDSPQDTRCERPS